MLSDLPPMPPRPGRAEAERSAYSQRVSPALKRLRIAVARAGGSESDGSVLMRYFVVAEHGDKKGRLHHHAVLCFSGAAALVVRKKHLETAFAAMRSNGSARYRKRVADLAFGSGRSNDLPAKDKAPMLRAAFGGQCKFQMLRSSDESGKARVSRYVSKYATKSVAADGSVGASYRLRASQKWGFEGAEKAVTDAAIAIAQDLGYRSVRVAGTTIPRRLYRVRWDAIWQAHMADLREKWMTSEYASPFGVAVQDYLADHMQGFDLRTGYGVAQRPLTSEERRWFVAYCLASGDRHLLNRPDKADLGGRPCRVIGARLLADGKSAFERGPDLALIGGEWVLPDGLTIGAWRRSGRILSDQDWLDAGFFP